MSNVAIIQAGWNHAPWLDPKATQELLERTPPHLRQPRSTGVPNLGAGNVYPIPLEDILVDAFHPLPRNFRYMYALDVGWNRTAALWAAVAPDDTVYLISEYYVGKQPPEVHAAAIRDRYKLLNNWIIPGVIDPASRGGSQKDGEKLFELYSNKKHGLGLNLRKAKNELESGIANVYHRLSSGKLKVFRHLVNWQNEYMTYTRDINGKIDHKHAKDHLMDCTRYITNNINAAKEPPSEREERIFKGGQANGKSGRKYNV